MEINAIVPLTITLILKIVLSDFVDTGHSNILLILCCVHETGRAHCDEVKVQGHFYGTF